MRFSTTITCFHVLFTLKDPFIYWISYNDHLNNKITNKCKVYINLFSIYFFNSFSTKAYCV